MECLWYVPFRIVDEEPFGVHYVSPGMFINKPKPYKIVFAITFLFIYLLLIYLLKQGVRNE